MTERFYPLEDEAFTEKTFILKDSGKSVQFESGMARDVQDSKARFDLLLAEGVRYEDQFLTRVANLMAKGAEKYRERNWELSSSEQELARFKSSAVRHLMQWLAGDIEEDHAAAVVFNLLAHETTKAKVQQ